jgi:hypothetical protein
MGMGMGIPATSGAEVGDSWTSDTLLASQTGRIQRYGEEGEPSCLSGHQYWSKKR